MTEAEYVREKVLSELLLHSCSNVEKVAFLHLAFKDKTYAKTGVFADEKVRQGMLNKLAASLNISKEDEGVRDKMSEEIHELMSVGVGVKKELFTKSGELCGESWKMASFSAPWVRSVCDEVVFGAGSRKISSFDFEDGDLGYSVVCDSALMNCCGFGAVVRDSVVLGFFPIFSQDAGPADAFRRNLRVQKGKISYVLHTGAGLMNLMVLGSAQVSWDPFRAMQVFKGREARVRFKLPDDMTEVPLYVLDDVQHDEGYCYLTAIRLEYMFLAVRTLGYLPDAEDLLRWFKDSPESERRGCALRFITDDLCHIVYIGGAMSLCEPLARVHPLVQCGAGNSDRIIQNSVEEVYAIVARRGSSAFAGEESGMCGLCQQVVILAEHKLCGGSVLPEVELRGKFSRVMDGVGICLVCLRTVPVDGHQCPGKDVSRGYCYGCFCCVRADGHLPVGDDPGRCKHRRESFDRKRVFLGDAVHTLDVRALVAAFETDRGKLTTVARDYISAGGLLGQRAYLEGVDPEAVEPGRSDHTWGSAFEARYEGSFRINYLGWLKSRLKGNRDVDFAVQDYLRGGSGLLSEMLT